MPTSSDYKDLLKLLNRHKVQYLVVGAYAVIYYAEPRYTKDLDIWINPSIENAHKVCKALKEFGAPLKGIQPEDFINKSLVYQIGVAPVRVDIIMGIPGLEFTAAWKQRNISSFEGVKVNIIGKNELIRSKKSSGRKQDEVDLGILLNSKRFKR
ncbi:MAG: hypothetical protein HY350_01595 [Candidatus Omnitrophica bacterium]|nr:hypothetical protein [Candidatus Omnitrophota bacterium]